MQIIRAIPLTVGIFAVLWCHGCQKLSDSTSKEPDLPDWLTEDDSKNDSSALFAANSAKLGLNLKPGDQFPLRKVVEQELTQDSLSSRQQANRSRLEILFAISVTEKQADRTKLSVRYDRVKYSHDVADEHVEYDSTSPPSVIPIVVQAYHDMVRDGFSFWIGANNQIVEVEGFQEFLDRCLRNVPDEYRKNVVLAMEASSGETGIANFVDNTIGLLPYGKPPNVGDSWERQGVIARPVPMHANNVYTLKELTDNFAVIDIRGTITPSTTVSSIEDGLGVRINIAGGDTSGSCTIFRETGLPRQSRVDRTVNMTVTMANAVEFRQRKRITTTIESFPSSGTLTQDAIPSYGSQQVGFTPQGGTPFPGTASSPPPPPVPGGSVPTMQITPPDLRLPGMVPAPSGTQSARDTGVQNSVLR